MGLLLLLRDEQGVLRQVFGEGLLLLLREDKGVLGLDFKIFGSYSDIELRDVLQDFSRTPLITAM